MDISLVWAQNRKKDLMMKMQTNMDMVSDFGWENKPAWDLLYSDMKVPQKQNLHETFSKKHWEL